MNQIYNMKIEERKVKFMLNKALKWIAFGYEAFLAIPIVGGLFILANSWTPLLIAGILHVVAIVLLNKKKVPLLGNVVGLLGAILGAIPVIGWLLHFVSAIILLVEAIRVPASDKKVDLS